MSGEDNINNKTKSGKKFGLYFALTTSFLIAAAIIFTAFYSANCIMFLKKDYDSLALTKNELITDSIVKSFKNESKLGSYEETGNLVNNYKENGYIKYVFAFKNSDKMIFFSSEPVYLNKRGTEIVETVLPHVNQRKNASDKQITISPYTMVLGISNNNFEDFHYNKMFDNLKLFVILFLLLGTIASALMSKMINKPLMKVVSGVRQFATGNFKHKIERTGFEEIDNLVDTYNFMSQSLNDLYESLEAKVEDRTKKLEQANLKLKETQAMMVHSEKMRSLGELVAGIAHEINNPINFIYGNIMILDTYQKDLMILIDKYQNLLSDIDQNKLEEIEAYKTQIDFEFLKSDISDLIKSCIEGVERTKNIILDLKNFSRMEEMVFSECDVTKEIDTTLNILSNKIKNRIRIHRQYEENIPKIEAYVGQINQVFMNILDNAQNAIQGEGDIYISVKKENENLEISFKDTGCGIKEENLKKVFDPFFTTKPVGQGTGLGMSIAYRVIEAHKGKISIESEVGIGTTITIVLPIDHQIANKNEASQGVING